jgi:DNA-binding MarR family transcriptional regulator
MSFPEDLANCLVLNTVSAARSLLRRHDAQLKAFGVTVQQFALLAAIRYNPGKSMGALAQKVALDRTSLTRNLDLLERKGLTVRVLPQSGNLRLCELTEQGDVLLDRLLEEWQTSNALLRAKGLSEADIDAYLRVVRFLA